MEVKINYEKNENKKQWKLESTMTKMKILWLTNL